MEVTGFLGSGLIFLFNIYSSGCVGSLLHPVRSLVVAHDLSSCVTQAPEHRGSVVAFSFSTACGLIVPPPKDRTHIPALQGRFVTTGPQ